MKLEINKDRLVEYIQKIDKVANKNTTLPILSCLILETDNNFLKIKTTNLDISLIINLSAKIKKTGLVAVPAQVFSNYISNLPKTDSIINLELKENLLHITSKTSDTTIKTQPTDDFPEIKETSFNSEIMIKSGDFIKGLNSVWYSASNSSIKPELSSVYIYKEEDDLVFVATDSFRLAEKKIRTQKTNEFKDVLIPFKNVSEIIRIFDNMDEDLNLYFKEDQIIIKSLNIYLTSRVVDGAFPDYKQIIPKEIKTEITLLKEDLTQGLKLSNIFSNQFNQISFSVLPKDNVFEIQSTSNDLGETKNIIKSKIKGENLKISFNSRYINDCLSSIKSEALNLNLHGLDKPMIIKGLDNDRFVYLVMPMNK